MPDATATSATFDNLLSALEAHEETNVIKGEAGYKFTIGDASFEILSPFDTEGADANETSIVLLMKYGKIKMLFMGDAAKSNEEEIINNYGTSYIKADLIKLGHHGSSSSSSEVFLKAVSPKYAVISCGEGNSYGHPHQETLDTLALLGITYFRTDNQSEIVAVTDGNSLSVKPSSD
jgi:competence protein ComEC